MPALAPPNEDHVAKVIEERLQALEDQAGVRETVTVEWRGEQRPIPVITMPVDLLTYNPDTHRVRAQRSLDPSRDGLLATAPFEPEAQAYLHQLLTADPTNPSKVDPAFVALQEDLGTHGQTEPGVITRAGVLVNGNTRRAALKQLGKEHMRVGVLPQDAALDDVRSIELSLQLRKDLKREYSFVNFLLAIDERARAGRRPTDIQSDFRIRANVFERCRWILAFIQEAIGRSEVPGDGPRPIALRLIDFEADQGKLEELYTAYMTKKRTSSDEAEALKEQRLLALVLNKSKTDLRLIESDFSDRYMTGIVSEEDAEKPSVIRIPGTSIIADGPSRKVTALRNLATRALRARAVTVAAADTATTTDTAIAAGAALEELNQVVDAALSQAGKDGRIIKKRLAPAERLSDANEDLRLCLTAIADARSTEALDIWELEDQIVELRRNLLKLAQLVTRGTPTVESEGAVWLSQMAQAAAEKA